METRLAITVRMIKALARAFIRYQTWRSKTSGLRVSRQRAAIELLTAGLNQWLKTQGAKPIGRDE